MIRFYCLVFFVFTAVFSQAQGSIRDSSLFITHVRIAYGAYLPGGHLDDRFGWNSLLGLQADVKFKSNLVLGAGGNFMFGNRIKENVLEPLLTSDGQIIDQNGNYSIVLTMQRGYTIHAYAGYLLPKFGPNPNSGILFTAGVGFMQHKIRIEHNQNPIPALEGDYLKGYDRLTNGFMLTQFIGYHFLSDRRLWNFFAGIDFMQGFTMNRRSYNFDTMTTDNTKRIDLMYGLRVGWILPLYSRAPKVYYY